MSDYPKYRLKKDTPNFEAGSIFIVRTDDILLSGNDDIEDIHGNFYDKVINIKHFDEWFEEVKEKPKWVRKQIKQALFDDNQLTDNESVWVKMRFLKDFYFERSDIRGIKHYKTGRDGYIEIEDNPNIVWEDEND